MELIPKAEFSIVTRASKAWIPELIAAAGPEVTETYIDFSPPQLRHAYPQNCSQPDEQLEKPLHVASFAINIRSSRDSCSSAIGQRLRTNWYCGYAAPPTMRKVQTCEQFTQPPYCLESDPSDSSALYRTSRDADQDAGRFGTREVPGRHLRTKRSTAIQGPAAHAGVL